MRRSGSPTDDGTEGAEVAALLDESRVGHADEDEEDAEDAAEEDAPEGPGGLGSGELLPDHLLVLRWQRMWPPVPRRGGRPIQPSARFSWFIVASSPTLLVVVAD